MAAKGEGATSAHGGLRLGVIGAGDVAARDYLPEAGRLLGGTVVAIASTDGRRAEELATRFGIHSHYAGADSLIQSGDVDAIVNLTPQSRHHAINLSAVAAGLHVYSEKPVATSAEEARQLRDAATRAGLVVVAAPSVLVFPQVLQAARLLSEGAIGAVRSATAQFLGGRPPWDGYESDPSPFFAAGSGPLVDVGVYPLHALTGLLGPVELVTAISARTQQSFVQPPSPTSVGRTVPVQVDDVWHVLMRHVGGAISSVRSDFATHGSTAGADVELNGDSGSIALSLMDMQAHVRLWSGAESTELPSHGERLEGPDHILGVQHLIDCVAGMPPVLTVDHAAHVLDILNAAEVSSRTGRQVTIETLHWT